MNWKSFFSGIAIGLIIGFLLFYFLGNRYEIRSGGPKGIVTIKLDKWTGKSWRTVTFDTWYPIKNEKTKIKDEKTKKQDFLDTLPDEK